MSKLVYFQLGAITAYLIYLQFKLSSLTTAWNHYHCQHEMRIDAIEKRLGLGFWSADKAGGQSLALDSNHNTQKEN